MDQSSIIIFDHVNEGTFSFILEIISHLILDHYMLEQSLKRIPQYLS